MTKINGRIGYCQVLGLLTKRKVCDYKETNEVLETVLKTLNDPKLNLNRTNVINTGTMGDSDRLPGVTEIFYQEG